MKKIFLPPCYRRGEQNTRHRLQGVTSEAAAKVRSHEPEPAARSAQGAAAGPDTIIPPGARKQCRQLQVITLTHTAIMRISTHGVAKR